MLPVSSATTGCSCHRQIPIYGGLKSLSSYLKAFDCHYVNKQARRFSYSSKTRPVTCFYSNIVGKTEQCGSVDIINQSLYQSGCISQVGYESGSLRPNPIFVEGTIESTVNDQLTTFVTDVNPLSAQKIKVPDIVSHMNDSMSDTINGGEDVLNESLDAIKSSLSAAVCKANEAVDGVIGDITSFLSKSGESAGDKLSGLSVSLKEGSGTAGSVVVDVLRRTVGTIEDIVALGGENIGNAYGYSKEFLPPEIQGALSSTEKVLSPIGTALQQVYIAFEGLEESVGLDPNDPLIPVFLLAGVSTVLWGSYRVLKYGGYAGDLSPQTAMELLRGNENAVLIDIRPENLRDRDGVPDLRRSARYRYASVTLPEVDGSVKKLLKGGRELEDALLAAVIRDLKIVEDRSKVLVMDADGSRSKSVARSLKKLGTKRPYQVLGGFQSWVKEGCRVKELKQETALTILNEEAEAILEEIKPTPLKLIGVGVGLAASAYSFLEWEKTLQFIGVIGIGQTILRRVASYQKAEDLKQDLRLLLAPVSIGGQAISWATGKLETGRGLPTSPSSSDVQSRVLQAAAKHESETTEPQVAAASGNEEVNVSEA